MCDPPEVLIPNSCIMRKFRMPRQSTSGALGVVSELRQLRHQAITMIALDLDVAVFYRAAGATGLFQARREFLERRARQRQTGDDRDALAASTGDFAPDPDLRGAGFRCRGG